MIMNYELDTTSYKRNKKPITKLVKNTWEEMGFFDVWRDLHPTQRDFSHYSAEHSVYSRIDYYFMQKEDRDYKNVKLESRMCPLIVQST